MVTFSPMKKSIDPAGSNSGKTRHNISLLLDRLLDDYNHHLRPDIGGKNTSFIQMKVFVTFDWIRDFIAL